MLNVVERVAREHGWLVISEIACAGFVDRLTNIALPGLLQTHDLYLIAQEPTTDWMS